MIKNRELFQKDPTELRIPNDGVTTIQNPTTREEWDVLHFELTSFVCEGEYQKGLERILSTFLGNLDSPKQPAVWVSGFYGSGKSHLVRVLQYLWQDVEFPDDARARSLVTLPTDIRDLLAELTTAGKRGGGLWSAAGNLSHSAGSVRLALLAIVFRNANLPDAYPLARFVIWLKQNGHYDTVKAYVESHDKDLSRELRDLYVSPLIAQGLLEAYPGFASSPAEARSLLKAQYPREEDISDDKFLATLEEVLELQSDKPGNLPLSLLIFDELQQFIGGDPLRTLLVQNVVETCSSRFGSRLLFVATGQAALQATPQLSKLQGRFTVRVMLSDTDVERVVREVVLRKAKDKEAHLRSVLDSVQGEIDRHLVGTKIGPSPADKPTLVPDYPLLPTRRRFWERILRAIDTAGTQAQLRTQLRMVYEATRQVANSPVGTVVPGDLIYDQQQSNMLQSSVLSREVATTIQQQNDGTLEGQLRARLCATIFLIGKLPTEGVAATGIRATADTLADLLVDNLVEGSAALRQQVPGLLKDLVEPGTLMAVEGEYRLQTRESAEWELDYRKRFTRIRADDSRVASDRTAEFRQAMGVALKGLRLMQGVSKTVRKFELHYGLDMPKADRGIVPVWVRDGWLVSEKTVREDAQAAGVESPVVFVLLPKQDADLLKETLASHAAAQESLDSRPVPTTPTGMEAQLSMKSRVAMERNKLDGLVKKVVNRARIFQGGGNEIHAGSLEDTIRVALDSSLVRLFPKFDLADHPKWGNVVKRAQDGAADALAAVGYTGDVDKHPVCQEIRAYIGGAGKKGRDIRKRLMGPGYGWPQDGVDGALLALVTGGFVRAELKAQPQSARQIVQSQIGVIDFYSEGITITVQQRLAVRKLLADLGADVRPGEEAKAIPQLLQRLLDLTWQAGGEPPLPPRPATRPVERLRALVGNEQLLGVYDASDELLASFSAWSAAKEKKGQREPRWKVLQRLLAHAEPLPIAAQVQPQAEAIETERALLADPDPVEPLVVELTSALRQALREAREDLEARYRAELAKLEAFEAWQQLDANARAAILEQHEISSLPPIRVGTEQELLATLDTLPLRSWSNRSAALPTRMEQARVQAARALEPQAVRVVPRPATLKSRAEVDAYLDELRAEIMQHIDAGKPVIV